MSSGRHVAPENIIGKSKLMTNRSTVVPYSTDGSPDSCLSCTRLLANCLRRSILFFVFRTLSFMMFFHVVQSSTVQIDLVWFEVILSDVRLLIPRCILHFGLLGRNYSFSSWFENVVRHSRNSSILVSFRNTQDKNTATNW